MRQFFETLITVTQRLKKRWDYAASSRKIVEVQKDLMRYTVDVTTNLAFGYDINTLEKEGDLIQHDLEKIFPTLNQRIMAVFPYWRYFKLPSDYAVDRALSSVHKAIEGFVDQARERLARNPELALRPNNLLESMLAASDEEGSGFTDSEIFGNVFTVLLAGEDTTANTLAWMMHFMTEYPEVQSKMQTEADRILCDSDVLDNFQNAEKLSYIEAVAHETMRLKPVAPVIFLETNEDVTLGGVDIPKHTMLMLPTRHGVMQESNFPSADTFQTEKGAFPFVPFHSVCSVFSLHRGMLANVRNIPLLIVSLIVEWRKLESR